MHYFTKDELRRLFAAAYERNRGHHLAMVTALWHGLRVGELITLTAQQVVDGQLSVRRLKGSNATCQPIHRDTDPLFDAWPIVELAKGKPANERLFPFCRQRCDQFIRKYAKLAGIHPDKAHMHTLKHSVAMLLWDATGSLGQVQSYLGHKAPGSTMCYLVEADARKAQNAIASISI
jgi:integrase/recombinase XerD